MLQAGRKDEHRKWLPPLLWQSGQGSSRGSHRARESIIQLHWSTKVYRDEGCRIPPANRIRYIRCRKVSKSDICMSDIIHRETPCKGLPCHIQTSVRCSWIYGKFLPFFLVFLCTCHFCCVCSNCCSSACSIMIWRDSFPCHECHGSHESHRSSASPAAGRIDG